MIKQILKVSFASSIAIFIINFFSILFIYPSVLTAFMGLFTAALVAVVFFCTTGLLIGVIYYGLYGEKEN